MRAWAIKQRLAIHHDVSLLVASSIPASLSVRMRRFLRSKAPGWYPRIHSEPSDWLRPPPRITPLLAACQKRIDLLHVFRLPMTPYAAPFFAHVPCHLDIDEVESRTRSCIAALAHRNGDHGLAKVLESEAAFYRVKEREWLPRFDRVYAASSIEATRLRADFPASDIRVLPNVVSPPCINPVRCQHGPFTLLFVGNLGYYPNVDAMRFLVREIVPIWRKSLSRDLRIIVVGRAAGRGLRRLMEAEPMVTYKGDVDDLKPIYRAANAAIVPLRAGGGTRIKILEAFANGLPVVATPEGAEGLEVIDGQHLLLGSTPESFSHACVRLMQEENLGQRLAASALAFVASHHTDRSLAALG